MATCTGIGMSAQCQTAGGGLWTQGTLTLTSSTSAGIRRPAVPADGGELCSAGGSAFYQSGMGTATFTNDTVTANTATCSNCSGTSMRAAVWNAAGTTTLLNTIVAKQAAGPDCQGTTSNGFNLDSDNSCNLTALGDQPGVSNPLLDSPLADNGGKDDRCPVGQPSYQRR